MWRAAAFVLVAHIICAMCGCHDWHRAENDFYQNATDFRSTGAEAIYLPGYSQTPASDRPELHLPID